MSKDEWVNRSYELHCGRGSDGREDDGRGSCVISKGALDTLWDAVWLLLPNMLLWLTNRRAQLSNEETSS